MDFARRVCRSEGGGNLILETIRMCASPVALELIRPWQRVQPLLAAWSPEFVSGQLIGRSLIERANHDLGFVGAE